MPQPINTSYQDRHGKQVQNPQLWVVPKYNVSCIKWTHCPNFIKIHSLFDKSFKKHTEIQQGRNNKSKPLITQQSYWWFDIKLCYYPPIFKYQLSSTITNTNENLNLVECFQILQFLFWQHEAVMNQPAFDSISCDSKSTEQQLSSSWHGWLWPQ